jgi:DNA polymerase-3 subunit delta'
VEDDQLIERLVHLRDGSPGQARALADPALWEFRRKFLKALSQPPFDSVALGKAWIQFVEEAGKESASQRRRAAHVVRLLVEFFNAALGMSVGGARRLAESDDLSTLEAFVKQTSPDQILDLLNRCLEADMHIDRRVQLVLILEALVDALGQKLKTA